MKTETITITITETELKEAFKTYETFKQFILDKFGIDIDYLEYQERINEQ